MQDREGIKIPKELTKDLFALILDITCSFIFIQ